MDFLKPCVRGLMLYDFKGGLIKADLARWFNSALGEDTVSDLMAQDWLDRFRTADHNTEHQPRSGQVFGLDYERLDPLVMEYLQQKHVSLWKLWRYQIQPCLRASGH